MWPFLFGMVAGAALMLAYVTWKGATAPPRSLWIVGQWNASRPWMFQGVFSTREKAKAACRTANYFLAPASLDKQLPNEEFEWPGLVYPLEAFPRGEQSEGPE